MPSLIGLPRLILQDQAQLVEGDEVAADVLGPHFLNRLAQVLRVPELASTPGDLEDEAPNLVSRRVASPHVAQLAICRRLEGWERLTKHGLAEFHCMDIQFSAR
ncbi:hypothetical protein [Burkholderia territorii]|uniref:hypothetical protein n=1 Tax=Burkholderia territorii TaxID=1503055 RepID=UPI0018C68892|nr:hypothetical protein [Burkholderia territorii]